jgi:hypothetical protein
LRGGPSSAAAAFEAAIKDIEFSSSSSPNGIRNFAMLLVKPIIYLETAITELSHIRHSLE